MASTFEYEVLRYQIGWKGFDYKKIKEQLNELGSQGWRVVGNHDANISAGVASEMVVLLERPTS